MNPADVTAAAEDMADYRVNTPAEVDAFCDLARACGVDINTYTLTLARACIAAGRQAERNSIANAAAREDALR